MLRRRSADVVCMVCCKFVFSMVYTKDNTSLDLTSSASTVVPQKTPGLINTDVLSKNQRRKLRNAAKRPLPIIWRFTCSPDSTCQAQVVRRPMISAIALSGGPSSTKQKHCSKKSCNLIFTFWCRSATFLNYQMTLFRAERESKNNIMLSGRVRWNRPQHKSLISF